LAQPRKGRIGRPATVKAEGENAMNYPLNVPLVEFLDDFDWNPDEVRDLIRTTPLRFDDEGFPGRYHAEQLFGLEAADFAADSQRAGQ
jgi:hypothetical protein